MKRTLGSLAVIAVMLGLAVLSEFRLGEIPREDPLGRKLLYLPSPQRTWQARRESNPQPAVLETAALPIELLA